jgi:hypothetical protein
MGDDIVARLRAYRIGCGIHCGNYDANKPLDECMEAADKIEQLQAALREIEAMKWFARPSEIAHAAFAKGER